MDLFIWIFVLRFLVNLRIFKSISLLIEYKILSYIIFKKKFVKLVAKQTEKSFLCFINA